MLFGIVGHMLFDIIAARMREKKLWFVHLNHFRPSIYKVGGRPLTEFSCTENGWNFPIFLHIFRNI